jgi:hypothetical protein
MASDPLTPVTACAALRGLLLDSPLFGAGCDERALSALLVAAAREPGLAGSGAVLRVLGLPPNLDFGHGHGEAADLAGRNVHGDVLAMVEVKTGTSRFNFSKPRTDAEHRVVLERGWEKVDQLTRYRLLHWKTPRKRRVLLLPQVRLRRIEAMCAVGDAGPRPTGINQSEWDNTPVAELSNWRMVAWENLASSLKMAVPPADVEVAAPVLPVLRLVARS